MGSFSLRIPVGPLSGPGWASWASFSCSVPPLDSLVWPLVGLCPLGQSLCSRFCLHYGALRSVAAASWGPVPRGSLSPCSAGPLCVRCSRVPLLDGSHSFAAPQPVNWRSCAELRAGSLLGASLEHLAAFWPSAPSGILCVSPGLLQPLCPGGRGHSLSTGEGALLWVVLFFGYVAAPVPAWGSGRVPPFPLVDCGPLHCFPLHSRLRGRRCGPAPVCFGRLSSPPSDVRVWTDGSVPSLFGPGGAGVCVTCSGCGASSSLSFSTGSVASGFTAEAFALRRGLVWCAAHLMICRFRSVLFLADSRSALSVLSSAPCLLPGSLWDVWSLASSLSSSVTLGFRWVPGHAGLPGNEITDLLAKAGASLPTDAIPCPLPPVLAKVRYSQYRNRRRHISHSHLNFQVPIVSSEELLSRPIRCELSCLRCHGHSLFLSSYLHRISRKENSDCSACGHPLQDLNHLLLDCPASERLRNSIFGSSLYILDLRSRPWGVARLLGLCGVPPRPHPWEGVG